MKQLPSGKNELGPVKVHEGQADEAPSEKIAKLEARVQTLERELAGAQGRYDYLKGVYDRLADTWNAFQATARPTVRNVHRAESSGEGARKLAEVLIGLMYDTATVKDLITMLQRQVEPTIPHPNAPRRKLRIDNLEPDPQTPQEG